MVILKGLKYYTFIGAVVVSISAAMYPIFIYPIMHVDEYKKIQAKNRQGIIQENVQPGNMKVWSDPFNRKEN